MSGTMASIQGGTKVTGVDTRSQGVNLGALDLRIVDPNAKLDVILAGQLLAIRGLVAEATPASLNVPGLRAVLSNIHDAHTTFQREFNTLITTNSALCGVPARFAELLELSIGVSNELYRGNNKEAIDKAKALVVFYGLSLDSATPAAS